MLEENKPVFGIIQFIAGFSNLLMLIMLDRKTARSFLNYIILVFNILVAASVAVYYFLSDSRYVKYAWILVTALYILVLVIQIKKTPKAS